MKYDITAKRLLELGKEEILKYFLLIDVEYAEILEEIPTESVSIRSTDFPIKIKEKNGEEYILLFEIQSNWRDDKIYDLIDYWARFRRKYKLPVKCAMLLLNPNSSATNKLIVDDIVFNFELIKIWELSPEDVLESDNTALMPFIPLFKNGIEYVDRSIDKLYITEIDENIKSDYITALAFFTGMRDVNVARELFEKRSDLMIESPVYDWIIERGEKKGKIIGERMGIEKGEYDLNVKLVKKMFSRGDDINSIVEIIDLPQKEIIDIIEKMKN